MQRKKYVKVSDPQRRELIRLVRYEFRTIKESALTCGIPYPNAKAIVQTFLRELRTDKKVTRFRLKKQDNGGLIFHNKLPYMKELYVIDEEIESKKCGIGLKRGLRPAISKSKN